MGELIVNPNPGAFDHAPRCQNAARIARRLTGGSQQCMADAFVILGQSITEARSCQPVWRVLGDEQRGPDAVLKFHGWSRLRHARSQGAVVPYLEKF